MLISASVKVATRHLHNFIVTIPPSDTRTVKYLIIIHAMMRFRGPEHLHQATPQVREAYDYLTKYAAKARA